MILLISTTIHQIPENASARSILYKFEPLILHVKCRNESMAQKLYVLAMNNGFRESGIGKQFQCCNQN